MTEQGGLPRRRPPEAEEAGGSLSLGQPGHIVEFPTPADPASQRVGVFPALASPKAERRRRRGPRRPRIVVTVPMWVLLGLAILAAIAVLLFIPAISPWPGPPPLTPSDDPEPGVGAIGTGNPETSIGPNAGPDSPPGATSSSRPSSGTSATSAPEPTSSPTGAQAPAADLYISHFSAEPLTVLGYRVTVDITNRGTGAGNWENIGVQVSGGIQLNMAVEQPQPDVQVFQGSGRACLAPSTPETARLDAGETLTIVFRIDTVLSRAPGPAQTPDAGCSGV